MKHILSKIKLPRIISGKRLLIVYISICLLIFFLKGATWLDVDFGWHLRSGEYILRNSDVPRIDGFSYTMPSYPYVDHAWLPDILIALLYPIGGLPLLSFVGVSLTLATFIIIYKFSYLNNKNRPRLITVFVFMLALPVILLFFFVRTQIVSWFIFALLVPLLLDDKYWKKYRLYLPILFLVWANMHGGFLLGLALIGLRTFLRLNTSFRENLLNCAILTAAVLIVFLNPYGAGLWAEVLHTPTSHYLRKFILEWKPFYTFFSPSVLFYFISSVFFMCISQKYFTLYEKTLYGLLLSQALYTTKVIPFFILFSIPLYVRSVESFLKVIEEIPMSGRRFTDISTALCGFAFILLMYQVVIDQSVSLKEKESYPVDAITYLKNNSTYGNIYNYYNWGGYLIWHYPEKKVFIDGRMAIWNYVSSRPHELDSALKVYLDIKEGDMDPISLFKDFQIDTVLFPKKETYNNYKFLFATLQENGWDIVYEDPVSIIYRKKD